MPYVAGMILTFAGADSLSFSRGSILVVMAASCCGLENNCTRMIASKSTYQIVALKGIFSGAGSAVVAVICGERLPGVTGIMCAMLLGFVAYGLSIFFYVRAQNIIGAARTSAYYAASPFIGAALSFVVLHENLSGTYIVALAVMMAWTVLVVMDTLILTHEHEHTHNFGGATLVHSHPHNHYIGHERHGHYHI